MSKNCAFNVSPNKNSCLRLGATLGELSSSGRDKVTFLTSSSLESFPQWLEQLIAESMGKDEKGIIPIVDEPRVALEHYGNDRFFVFLFYEEDNTVHLNNYMKKLERAGYPTTRINLPEKITVGQEIFCWEIAVAAAGSILGINPFNQPNVELSKQLTQKEMKKISVLSTRGDHKDEVSIKNSSQLVSAWKKWLGKIQKGNYIALQAYLSPTQKITNLLQAIRLKLLNNTQLATTYGYGPRFLHSTGQLHKGGPNTGLFLQLVDKPMQDVLIPETNYTFGSLICAQYRGDYQALTKLKRRVLRINLEKNPVAGLERLLELIDKI